VAVLECKALTPAPTTKRKKPAVAPAVARIAPMEIRRSGAEVSMSIMEPRIMAAMPPRVSTPWETTLISAMNITMARRMSRTPA
jgi:hypothetical protein